MNDDKIKDLFAAYNPQLPPDSYFMERLTHKMQAVELLKDKTAELRHRNRIAVRVAMLTGVAVGIVLTICFPYILGILENITKIAGTSIANFAADYIDIGAWIIIAVLTGTMSYTTYDLTRLATSRMSD